MTKTQYAVGVVLIGVVTGFLFRMTVDLIRSLS